MDIDDEMSDALFLKLLELEKVVRRNLSERNADNDAENKHHGQIQ